MHAERKIAVIMFTDVVGSSARMGENEAETLGLVGRDFALMHQVVKRYCGDVLKHLGDGMLISFSTAVDAVLCAIAIQKAMHRIEARPSKSGSLQHRIGIHLGVVYAGQHDIMGDNVNIAARIQGEAEPGGICISQPVFEMIRGKINAEVKCAGTRSMKNIKEKMTLYSIQIAGHSSSNGAQKITKVTAGLSRSVSGIFYGLCIMEIVLLSTGILSRQFPILDHFFFDSAQKSKLLFLEGILKDPFARMVLFLLCYTGAFFGTRKISVWMERIAPRRFWAGLLIFVIFNLVLAMILASVFSALGSTDPSTSLW